MAGLFEQEHLAHLEGAPVFPEQFGISVGFIFLHLFLPALHPETRIVKAALAQIVVEYYVRIDDQVDVCIRLMLVLEQEVIALELGLDHHLRTVELSLALGKYRQ